MKPLVLSLATLLYLLAIPLHGKAQGVTPSMAKEVPAASGESAAAQFPGPGSEPGKLLNLEPFYLFHERDGQFRVERLIVRLELGASKEAAGVDPNAPKLRKALYDLFSSGQEETALGSQALEELQRQWGKGAIKAVTVSRSFLIIR